MLGSRREANAKWNTRRFNAYDTVENYCSVPRRERALYEFCKTDVRLIALYWFNRLGWLLRMWRWHGDQHNCPCAMCRSHTRKYRGNAWKAKPLQERRLIESLNADPGPDGELYWDLLDDPTWLEHEELALAYEEDGGEIGGRGPGWWKTLRIAHTPTGGATIAQMISPR